MAAKREVTLSGYDGLAMAVIDMTFDDLVDSYKTILSLMFPAHGRNTIRRWTHTKYKHGKLERAYDMCYDCLDFFLSDDYEYYRLNLDIEGSDIIKQARHKALDWARDRDADSVNRSRKYVNKQTKKAIERHERKEKKRNG